MGEPPPRELVEQRLGRDPEAVATVFSDSMADLLARHSRDRRLIEAPAGQGVIGTFASPYDSGTASVHFHHSSGRLGGRPGAWGNVRGGMGMVSFALCDAATEAGALVATGVPVAAIHPREGVELEDGTVVHAPVVVSNADPRRTVALLGDAAPGQWRRQVLDVPMESPVVKVNFVMRALPDFGVAHATRATINVTRGIDALHDSYLAARDGDADAELWCELYCASAYDQTVAPEGLHVMSALAVRAVRVRRRHVGRPAPRRRRPRRRVHRALRPGLL